MIIGRINNNFTVFNNIIIISSNNIIHIIISSNNNIIHIIISNNIIILSSSNSSSSSSSSWCSFIRPGLLLTCISGPGGVIGHEDGWCLKSLVCCNTGTCKIPGWFHEAVNTEPTCISTIGLLYELPSHAVQCFMFLCVFYSCPMLEYDREQEVACCCQQFLLFQVMLPCAMCGI